MFSGHAQPRRSMTATAFAVFAAGWMLLVMQPCLAALDQVTASHAGHHDCPHCPVDVVPPCADGTLDCSAPDSAAGGEHAKPKPPIAVALTVFAAPQQSPERIRTAFHHERPQSTGPPFTERFCCHLE
ncbi:MAG: hypothetical protein LC632_02175 [Xanthomonadaceae bacterium]|nr:hypothetical protein [Xanthomonadaceae bacterium]